MSNVLKTQRSLNAEEIAALNDGVGVSKPMLVDQDRPRHIAELDFHKELDERIAKLVTERPGELPNLILYGPKGAGKKTRVNCMLNQLFQPMPDMISLMSKTNYASLSVETRSIAAGTQTGVGGVSAKGNNYSSSGSSSEPGGAAAAMTSGGLNSYATEMTLNEDEIEDLSLAKKDEKKQTKPRGAKASALAVGDAFGLSASEFAKISSSNGSNNSSSFHGTNYAASKASSTREQIACIQSPFHLEITPADLDHKDFLVVRQCIKEFCEISSSAVSIEACLGNGQRIVDSRLPAYRVVVINGADQLTFTAQASLRRIMEQYMKNIRFILVAEQISCILPALQSRCALLRVPRPNNDRLLNFLIKKIDQMQIGGRFGGDRTPYEIEPQFYNEEDNFRYLPLPTTSMLIKNSRHDASYLLMLMMHNSQTEPEDDAEKDTNRKRKAQPTPPLPQQPSSSTFIKRSAPSANKNSFLTQHSRLLQPSWLENTILIGQTLVLGYGIVHKKSSILAGWASDDVGCNTYEKAMLIWMRRVANELLSRCVPMRRFCGELVLAMLAQIEEIEKKVEQYWEDAETDCWQAPSWWASSVIAPEHWSHERCEALRIALIQLCAAFQQRIAVAFRPIVQIDALFVHLCEVCAYHRHGMSLPKTVDHVRFK